MAVFECDHCGKCCVSLGSLITIERQLNDRDYYCRCKIDNSIFLARVESAYCEEIADEFAAEEVEPSRPEKRPCTFLRKNRNDEGICCSIYSTRPNVCRDFRCYRMIIYNREGDVCGRVIGKNILRTEDTALDNLWNERVTPVPYSDTMVWNQTVTIILVEQGYRADIVE